MRLVIKYKSGRALRGLDDETIAGESVRTVCEIKPEYNNLVDKTGNGDNVDYDFNAETPSERDR